MFEELGGIGEPNDIGVKIALGTARTANLNPPPYVLNLGKLSHKIARNVNLGTPGYLVKLGKTSPVSKLLELVTAELDVPEDSLQLVYEGRSLEINKTMEDNGIVLPGPAARRRGATLDLMGELTPIAIDDALGAMDAISVLDAALMIVPVDAFDPMGRHPQELLDFNNGLNNTLLQISSRPVQQVLGERPLLMNNEDLNSIVAGVLEVRNRLSDRRGKPAVYVGPRSSCADGIAFNGTTADREQAPETEVARQYREQRLHPQLFDVETGWREEWFDEAFLAALRENTGEAWSGIINEVLPGEAFSCKMFSERFCQLLIEEVEHFSNSGLPASRPNTMNKYGVVLNEIGWKPMVDSLQDHVMAKLARRQWPHVAPFDNHHTFIVRYKEGEDLGLDMHTDGFSDVTFNVCLGKQFTGAGLSFCGMYLRPNHRKHRCTFQHQIGHCVWHLARLRHGADDIQSGERLNLILGNTSSAYRRTSRYKDPPRGREDGPPDPICLSFTHDRDYGVFRSYSPKNEQFRGQGVYPLQDSIYKGFRDEPMN